LHPAFQHDAISFVVGSAEFSQRFTLGRIDKALLDTAHDAMAIYEFLRNQQCHRDFAGGQPFLLGRQGEGA